jgi:formiminotetrahydrofolate cyclodeaminase
LNHPDSRGSILDLTLGELLQRLGSSDPAPGGGAAAAITGALGAALVQMTAKLTVGRPRFGEVEEQAQQIAREAGELARRLGKLADEDAAAFDAVSAAYKLPRADDAEKTARTRAIQSALVSAAAVPLATARLSAEVVELAEAAAPVLNPAVISDVMVGAVLAEAALRSAAVNVEINVASITDTAAAGRLSSELDAVGAGVTERVERVVEIGRSRFPRANR